MDISGVFNYRNIRFAYPLLLLTVAVYFASSVFVFFMDLRFVNYSPISIPELAPGQQKPLASIPVKDYKVIRERNLFAVKTDEIASMKEADLLTNLDKLALTSLNCTLIGTVINEDGESWAIIRDNQSNREEKAAVGSVFSGAKVKMILRNKVVLHFNGKDELLVMGIEKIRAERQAQADAGKEEKAGEVSAYKVSRDFVQESINNLPKIMASVRIKPYFKDGKPQGFKISRLKEGSLLKTMGFQDEDIIKSVNGQDILTPEDVLRVYNNMKNSSFFSVSVLRNNQLQTINFKVR